MYTNIYIYINNVYTNVDCSLQVWLGHCAFWLIFGSMLMKTWRYIYTYIYIYAYIYVYKDVYIYIYIIHFLADFWIDVDENMEV
jgi:hypothetical protein